MLVDQLPVHISIIQFPLLFPCRYLRETRPKLNNVKTKKASSFHEFATSTNDAWDIDDEEDEDFCWTPTPASSTPSGLDPASSLHKQVAAEHAFVCGWSDTEISDSSSNFLCHLCRISIKQMTLGECCPKQWLRPRRLVWTSRTCRRRMWTTSWSTAGWWSLAAMQILALLLVRFRRVHSAFRPTEPLF